MYSFLKIKDFKETNFFYYLVRYDNHDIFRLPKKDYSMEDTKNDLLEQIPIFYEKLRKISPELLPTKNRIKIKI